VKYLKIAGIVWGFAYFVFGAWSSFTLNANDTWASVALLFGLFLLPLPITVIAIWLPKVAGKALLGCVAVNVVAVVAVVAMQHAHPLSDIGRFALFIVLYDLPHLFFGVGYHRAARVPRDADPDGQKQSVSAA
jgi:hypothetical protein